MKNAVALEMDSLIKDVLFVEEQAKVHVIRVTERELFMWVINHRAIKKHIGYIWANHPTNSHIFL